MAVFKRIMCSKCNGHIAQVPKENVQLSDYVCPVCGGAPRMSSNWYVSTYLVGSDGRKRKHTKSVGSKKEAEAYERAQLTEREDGLRHDKRKDWTFKAFVPTFFEWLEQRQAEGKMADGTAISYRSRTNVHLLPWLGTTDIRKIDDAMVDRYRIKRLKQVSPASVNKEVATLKKALAIAVKTKWLRVNPLAGYELLDEDNERDRYLSDDEIARLLVECQSVHAPKHLYPIVLLGLNTGLRIDGALGIRWENVKWELGEIHRIVKGGKLVRIPMTDELKAALKAWQTRDGITRMSGWVFPSTKKPDSPMLVSSNFGLAAACKRANIKDCTFHTLRHTFATHFLEKYPDHINTLMSMMGHSSLYMTRRYAHITDRARHETMKQFQIGGVK